MTRGRLGRDGFTLVETLVAVAVVAVVSVALQRGLVAARQTLARVEGVVSSEAVARGILETRLHDLAAGPGIRQGATDGHAWTVTAEPLDLAAFGLPAPPPAAPSPVPANAAGPSPASPAGGATAQSPVATQKPQAVWLPLRVTITVETGSGPSLAIETVHLAKAS